MPKSKIEIQNNEEVSKSAGTRPIRDLIDEEMRREVKVSPIHIGTMKRILKFLLKIAAKQSIWKQIHVLNKKS